jgi:hypothetical protein
MIKNKKTILKSKRVLVIVSREVSSQPTNGREKTLKFIEKTISECSEIKTYRVTSILERWSFGRCFSLVLKFISSFALNIPIPLQVLIFYDPKQISDIHRIISEFKPETVYFDGVRTGYYAIAIRGKNKKIRIVCDFDDLMSRRYRFLATMRYPIVLGYIRRNVPKIVKGIIELKFVSRLLAVYEWKTLINIEKKICEVSDQVVLVSCQEVGDLNRITGTNKSVAIPPCVEKCFEAVNIERIERFIFIGSDFVIQNRITIATLLKIWQRLKPKTILEIYGKQYLRYDYVENVKIMGYVPDLRYAYKCNSVMLAPSFIDGGVKTKVLESAGYGVIPIGNECTFSGISVDCSKLIFSDKMLDDLVCFPENWIGYLNNQCLPVVRQLISEHNAGNISEKWRHLI